ARVHVCASALHDALPILLSGMAGTGVIVYFGGVEVADGAITAGAWFLFIQALQRFWFPLTSIASFWSQFQQGLSSSERIFALIRSEEHTSELQSRENLVC